MSKLQVFSIVLIVALCALIGFCLFQAQQVTDLEVKNSDLEKQIKMMRTEHSTALEKAKEREDAKSGEIAKLETAAQEAEEAFGTLQSNHDQLEKEVKNLQSLRRRDRSKAAKLSAEIKDLKVDLSATQAILANYSKSIKEIRESVGKDIQATERMLASVAQSRKTIAEINETIDRIKK